MVPVLGVSCKTPPCPTLELPVVLNSMLPWSSTQHFCGPQCFHDPQPMQHLLHKKPFGPSAMKLQLVRICANKKGVLLPGIGMKEGDLLISQTSWLWHINSTADGGTWGDGERYRGSARAEIRWASPCDPSSASSHP